MNIRERCTYLLGLSKDNRYFLCGALNASKATSPEEQAANLFSAGSWPWDGRAHLQCWCCSLNLFWEMSPRTQRLALRTYSGLPLFPCVRKKTSSHIPLERLTQIACMGTTKLKSCFKKYYDCTITEYVQQRRMSQAEYLLAYTELTVGQVAQTVGYSTSSRFAELFRKSTGLLPLEYRKNAQRK